MKVASKFTLSIHALVHHLIDGIITCSCLEIRKSEIKGTYNYENGFVNWNKDTSPVDRTNTIKKNDPYC